VERERIKKEGEMEREREKVRESEKERKRKNYFWYTKIFLYFRVLKDEQFYTNIREKAGIKGFVLHDETILNGHESHYCKYNCEIYFYC
jgi:hypothetical protein